MSQSTAAKSADGAELDSILTQIESIQSAEASAAKKDANANESASTPGENILSEASSDPISLGDTHSNTEMNTENSTGVIEEFRGDGGEASLEETLSELKDEPTQGKSLFDESPGSSGNSDLPQTADELVAAAEAASELDAEIQEGVDNEVPAEGSEILSETETDQPIVDEAALEAALAEAEARINEVPVMEESAEYIEGASEEVAAGTTARARMEKNFMKNVHSISEGNGDSGSSSGEMAEGGLTLSVQGSMTLALVYERDNSRVMINFQDGFLCLQMPDGTEIKIPVHSASAGRKAA